MPQVMWNTSFSEVVFIYNYLSLSHIESYISLQFPFTLTTLFFTCNNTALTHFQPQTEQRLECQSPVSCHSGCFTGVISPALFDLFVCFAWCFPEKSTMSHQYRIFKVHMVSPHSYFASLARLNYVKVSPSVLGAVERHSATRHPAQCTSLCWSFYGLWLEFITSLRDSDYKTLVTMLTKAHVISAVVFKHSGVCGLYMASYCAPLVLCDCNPQVWGKMG